MDLKHFCKKFLQNKLVLSKTQLKDEMGLIDFYLVAERGEDKPNQKFIDQLLEKRKDCLAMYRQKEI